MVLERVLQLTIATFTVLGTVLLGMGERTVWLPLGMIAATVASFWLTDVTGWVRLNRSFSNGLAVLAPLAALASWRSYAGFALVFVIANMLFYLQMILLFQKKELRTYTLLLLLSLLQVLVSAAFNQEIGFGIFLFGYLFVGLSALTLMLLHREQREQRPSEPPAPAAPSGRWPLAEREFHLSSVSLGRSPLRGALLLRLLGLSGAVAGVALVIFLLTPRLGRGNWNQAAGIPLRIVGFAPKVTLGELGELIEDPQEVMRVQLWDSKAQHTIQVSEALYLRGAALDTYEQGHWSCQAYRRALALRSQSDRRRMGGRTWVALREVNLDPTWTRQQITVEPMEQPELFCVWPCALLQPDDRLSLDIDSQRLVRRPELAYSRFSYELVTPAVRGNTQVALTPQEMGFPPEVFLLPVPQTGPDGLPGLVALAEQWSRDEGSGELLPPYARAVKLERQLRSSKQFQYSMQGQPRNPQLDPVEDFVTAHPAGHCEYFATALALMLRSQGIPSRVVMGFKCDEWNDLGQFYQVRQLHAHSWVEAYLDPTELPEDLRRPWPDANWRAGGWLRLDPTPAGEGPSLAKRLMVGTDRYFAWLDYLWNSYVAGINMRRQQQAIYGPAVRAVSETGRRLFDRRGWSDLLGRLGDPQAWAESVRWPLVAAGLAVVAGLLLLPPVLRRWGWWRGSGRRLRPRRHRNGSRSSVEFYRRLEAVLARRGLVREAAETPREFAVHARDHLEHACADPQVAGLPEQVVEVFYHVRFGRASLDRAQAQAVEQALRQLERVVRARR